MTLNLSLQNLLKEIMVRKFPMKKKKNTNLGLLQRNSMTQSLVGKADIHLLEQADTIKEVFANLCLNLTMIVTV